MIQLQLSKLLEKKENNQRERKFNFEVIFNYFVYSLYILRKKDSEICFSSETNKYRMQSLRYRLHPWI